LVTNYKGLKCASTKLKRQLEENDENVKKPRHSLVGTFSHGKNGANHRTVMFGLHEIFATCMFAF